MTPFVPYLLRTGSVLAVAALLSACSSNNNATRMPNGDMTVPEPPPGPTADQVARTSLTGLDSSVATLTTLSAGADKDGSALKMAKDYSAMFETPKKRMEGFDGNSMKAMESAQKVLDAHKSLQDALTAAKTAKTAAEEAKEALPADAEPLLVKALDDAIKKADTQIAATEKILAAKATDKDTLASYVRRVEGTDADNPHTAADQGMTVARAIAAALAPKSAPGTTTPDGSPVRYRFGITPPPDTVLAANKVVLDDATGRTWAEIVGADKIRKERVGAGNAAVSVASVAGLDASDVNDTLTSSGTYTDGEEITGGTSTYKGIPGTVYCLGDDCAVGAAGTTDAGKLTGSWYFTPTDPMAYWTQAAGATTYTEETLYTRYGHWLEVAANGDATVRVYAGLPSGEIPSDLTPRQTGNWAAHDTLARSASYSGDAVGRSVRKFFDANDQLEDIQSGRFTADVNLTAEFGGTRRLSGTVTNFESPDNPRAVHPDWSVTLKGVGTNDKAVVTGFGTVTSRAESADRGVAQGTGQAGAWSATSYGEADKRPVGIHGWFNAHFTNGAVAGAYATRKDD